MSEFCNYLCIKFFIATGTKLHFFSIRCAGCILCHFPLSCLMTKLFNILFLHHFFAVFTTKDFCSLFCTGCFFYYFPFSGFMGNFRNSFYLYNSSTTCAKKSFFSFFRTGCFFCYLPLTFIVTEFFQNFRSCFSMYSTSLCDKSILYTSCFFMCCFLPLTHSISNCNCWIFIINISIYIVQRILFQINSIFFVSYVFSVTRFSDISYITGSCCVKDIGIFF